MKAVLVPGDVQTPNHCQKIVDQAVAELGDIDILVNNAVHQSSFITADVPNPTLLAYTTMKGAIHNSTAGLAQLLAEKGIRANAVAPGPVWTPLIPSTMPEDAVENFEG